MRLRSTVTRSEISWVLLILGGIAFLVGVAVAIGSALAGLPVVWGTALSFAVVVLSGALVALTGRGLWAKLPR